MRQVQICEVGPRDGLQNAKQQMPTEVKKAWINALAAAGLNEIEVGSFVPPKLIPAMAERGYSRAYATALAVSAGVLAPLIPPSIAFVIWGVIAEQSIAKLFISGVLPGLLMAIGMAGLVIWHARRHRIARGARASGREVLQALRGGVWVLLAPVLVLGGIYGGIFTPTEAAVVACTELKVGPSVSVLSTGALTLTSELVEISELEVWGDGELEVGPD